MQPQEPLEIKTDDQTPADPIQEMELPQVERAVVSGRTKPRKKLVIVAAVLILLAGAAAAYVLIAGS